MVAILNTYLNIKKKIQIIHKNKKLKNINLHKFLNRFSYMFDYIKAYQFSIINVY